MLISSYKSDLLKNSIIFPVPSLPCTRCFSLNQDAVEQHNFPVTRRYKLDLYVIIRLNRYLPFGEFFVFSFFCSLHILTSLQNRTHSKCVNSSSHFSSCTSSKDFLFGYWSCQMNIEYIQNVECQNVQRSISDLFVINLTFLICITR